MISKKIYVSVLLGVISGVAVGNAVSRKCCVDKGGNIALGFLIGCLSTAGITTLIYIAFTESQRNCCSGCSKLIHRAFGDDHGNEF